MDRDEIDMNPAGTPRQDEMDRPTQPAQEIVDPREPQTDQGPNIEIGGKDQGALPPKRA
jgi:hypothetical protein